MNKKSFQKSNDKGYSGKLKFQTMKNQEFILNQLRKKTQLFLKTISFDNQQEQKSDVQFNTAQNFNKQNLSLTSLNTTQKEFTSLPKRTKFKNKLEDERNQSESKKMYKTMGEWKEEEQFKTDLELMVGQLSCNQIESHRQQSLQNLKSKNCAIQQDFYQVKDPCFKIFDELKKYKCDIPKDESLQQFSNLYKLLFEEDEQELCDIQYISHKPDILDKNTIIPVIHEEYQDIEQEIIQNISQFCSNNQSVIEESVQSERKQPLAPSFRVKKRKKAERSSQSEQSFASESKTNHFELFDQEYERIQNNLDKNKELMNKKINIKTQHLKKQNK